MYLDPKGTHIGGRKSLQVTSVPYLTTPRLRLGSWSLDDVERLREMKQNKQMMTYIPGGALTAEQALELTADAFHSTWQTTRMGLFSVHTRSSNKFLGYVGIDQPGHWPFPDMHWMTRRTMWNCNFATEAAAAVMDWAFETHDIGSVLAIALPGNGASERVMQKLGMTLTDAEICPLRGVPVRAHVIDRAHWLGERNRVEALLLSRCADEIGD